MFYVRSNVLCFPFFYTFEFTEFSIFSAKIRVNSRGNPFFFCRMFLQMIFFKEGDFSNEGARNMHTRFLDGNVKFRTFHLGLIMVCRFSTKFIEKFLILKPYFKNAAHKLFKNYAKF